ncbi:helix-turn-helix domain-containing protein [Rhizobium herbae]|uniref:AraC-like DNA-binding protein n=1 Tax=Rhizobium herbae TaxID=508661 RepID=A0ABS4EGW8_9HYPH|nr:AraC family transcriptional regulator [Rhizobium herbae]MBP1857185.1 AraC-like DNA-binding protein [Rhizobium herbae]
MASSAGNYREWRPAAPLAAHFRCIWSHSLPRDFDKRIAVVPDGCSDIIWSESGLCIVGPDRTAAFPPLQPGTTVIGIRFQPGAAAAWLNLSLAEITGETVALSDLWGAFGIELHQRLLEAPSIAEKLSLLQAVLQRRALETTPPAADMRRTFAYLAQERGDGEDTIRNLSRDLGYGERTFRRRCIEQFGYGPKTLDRILRFQRLLRLFRSARGDALSILAFEACYADQAHMSREVKTLAGLSPTDIRRQLV